jgi:hypothetical protein
LRRWPASKPSLRRREGRYSMPRTATTRPRSDYAWRMPRPMRQDSDITRSKGMGVQPLLNTRRR